MWLKTKFKYPVGGGYNLYVHCAQKLFIICLFYFIEILHFHLVTCHCVIIHFIKFIHQEFSVAVFTWERIMFRKAFRNVMWLGSWFELRAFTCIANAFPITIRICALRGNILFLLRSPRWLTHAWLQHGFSAHFQNAHARITFRNSFVFTCPRIRLSKRITIQNALFFCVSKRVSKAWFERALRSHGLKSGFQIRKGPNHLLKRLSERDSSSCEHSQCYM